MTLILKRYLTLFISLASIITIFYFTQIESQRDEYEKFLVSHEYMQRDYIASSALPKRDRPDLAWEQNFLLTMDPSTKSPEPSRLLNTYNVRKKKWSDESTLQQLGYRIPGGDESPWVERGPTNVAGRTRALAFDPNIENKVWAGSVGGGLWYNEDITDASVTWSTVDDFWGNLAITAIAFDPNDSQVIYVGTGEGYGNSDAIRGAGVWKSSDGGDTWNQLSATSEFYYVKDLAVRDESEGVDPGVLYVCVSRGFSASSVDGADALQYSSDGGVSFSSISSFSPVDIEIAADDRIWVGTDDGEILYSDNGTDWTLAQDLALDRVALACAPSNANFVYAVIEDDLEVGAMVYTADGGETWTNISEPADEDLDIPDDDFSNSQAWYDLVIAVDPNDENTVVTGGIDLFRSTDNGSSWTQISKWSNNNRLRRLSCSEVHADQHAIIFKGAGSEEVLFGNDGGVYYSTGLENAGSEDAIASRNNEYNVTQFYACAIHPGAQENSFLAGSQDNGTQSFSIEGLNETSEVIGGDGAFCFIDQQDPDFQIGSYVYNSYYLSDDEGDSFNTTLVSDFNTGLFINPADYDDNMKVLYSALDENGIHTISNITGSPSVSDFSIDLGSTASHIRVSPHTTTSSTLFIGTMSGRLFKVEDADSNPSSTEITGDSFPTGSISCVEIGANEEELVVTFYNYGVTSVWYTQDGGTTWSDKEGDLPDMPVRWALFNPLSQSEVILATELGVWSTENFGDISPTWTSSNSGLANVRVDMLQIRSSDYEVIAATHGRGVFSNSGFQFQSELCEVYETPFSEDFEGGLFPPLCWIRTTGENGLGEEEYWKLESEKAFMGDGAAAVGYEAIEDGASEDWLITPEIDLTNNLNSTLSFWSMKEFSDEWNSIYKVMVSTSSQDDLSTFSLVDTFVEDDLSHEEYSERVVDLSDFDGSSVYLAFVFEQNDGDYWYLDDISLFSDTLDIQYDDGLSVCLGESVTLYTIDDEDFSYEWLLNGETISGASSHSHDATEAGNYSVTVTSPQNSLTSSTVEVTAALETQITSEPEAISVSEGQSFNLLIEAEGTDLTYQWMFDGEILEDGDDIQGTQSSELDIISASLENIGNYQCIVSGKCGSSISSTGVEVSVIASLEDSSASNASLDVYPNPTDGIIHLRLGTIDYQGSRYYLQNLNGQIVKEGLLSFENQVTEIDFSRVSSGLYILGISSNAGNEIRRIQIR